MKPLNDKKENYFTSLYNDILFESQTENDVLVIPKDTKLYHATTPRGALQIQRDNKLKGKSGFFTRGGLTTEYGLVYFTLNLNQMDAWLSGYELDLNDDELYGTHVGYEYTVEKDLKLVSRNHLLSLEEANKLNNLLKIPDYKSLNKGDRIHAIEWRFTKAPSHEVLTTKNELQKVSEVWLISLKALNYDGYYTKNHNNVVFEVALVDKGNFNVKKIKSNTISKKDINRLKKSLNKEKKTPQSNEIESKWDKSIQI